MNPSALFTYARVSISRLPLIKNGEEEMSIAFLERETFFVSARSLHFLYLLSSLFHLTPFIPRYISSLSRPSSLSLSHFLTPLLTNLHILAFSCNGMHNPPFPFSSLSHLHPLVSLLSASRFLQFRRPLAFAFQTSRVFTVLSILLLICCLRQVYDSSRLKLRIHRNPCRER